MLQSHNAHIPHQPNQWSREAAEAPVAPPANYEPATTYTYYEQPAYPAVQQYALPPAPANIPKYPAMMGQELAPVAPVAPEKNKRNISKLTAGLAGVAAITIGTAGVLAAVSWNKISNRVDEITGERGSDFAASDTQYPGQVVESAPSILGDTDKNGILTQQEANLMSITDYESIDPAIRAEHKNEALNDYLHTAWEDIQVNGNLTTEERRILYMPDLEKPREEWSDQDYLNQHALAVWFVTGQKDSREGQQSFAAITSPDKDGYDEISSYIKNNPGMKLKYIHEAVETPLSNVELKNTLVGSVELDENGGRLVGNRLVGDENVRYTLYSNMSDSKGNLVPVVELSYSSLRDSDLTQLIQKKGR